MASTKRDKLIWDALYALAINFPDGADQGLTQQRLKGYYDFFMSLRHVLPTQEARTAYKFATSSGDGELTWEKFAKVRTHKELSRWVFYVHDHMSAKPPSIGYVQRYKLFSKYRQGSPNGHDTNNTIHSGGLKKILLTRPTSIDLFLKEKFPDEFTEWTRKHQVSMRTKYIDDAVKWYWKRSHDHLLSKNSNFNAKSSTQKRELIEANVRYSTRANPRRIINRVAGIPGAFVNKVLG